MRNSKDIPQNKAHVLNGNMNRSGQAVDMSTLSAIGNTPLVELVNLNKKRPKVRIFGKLEGCNPGGSVKDRPVYYMIKKPKNQVSSREGK